MTVIKLYRHGLSKDEVEELLKMAASAAGIPQSGIEIVEEVGEPEEDCDDEVILTILTPSINTDDKFEKNLEKAPIGGRRAICIWGKTGEQFPLPPAVQKFSYSIIPWNLDKLRAAIVLDDVTCFENPSGQPLPPVDTDRNVCVVEQKKPK